MSIDTGALLATVGPYVASAIATSGTTIDVARPDRTIVDGAVDPDTLTRTVPAALPVAAGVPAIVTPAARQGATPEGPRAPDPSPTAYTILTAPDITDLHAGDVATVTTSLDGRLVGRRFVVVDLPDSFAGVVRTLTCEPLP